MQRSLSAHHLYIRIIRMVVRHCKAWWVYLRLWLSQLPGLGFAAPWNRRIKARAHGLKGRLVVSLTSHPPRFHVLKYAISCLLYQSVRADHVILWIAENDMALLPPDILAMTAQGLEIRTSDDIKSYKKILPTLDLFPDAYICTADDDLYYRPTWLEELVEGIRHTSQVATCHRAHMITMDNDGRFKPYMQWKYSTRLRGEHAALFPTSGGGVLYPPGALAHTPEDRKALLELAPLADDVGMFWIACKNGVRYKTIGRFQDLILLPDSQAQSLARYNWSGGNDLQISKMAEKYGYPNIDSK